MPLPSRDQPLRYPVFLINLDRQPGRLRFMQAQLAALGIAPIRIAAVNGRDPVERARSSAASYAQLTPGEIGCFESHRRLWRKIVDEAIPAACILEDDMLVADDFATLDIPDDILAGLDLIKVDYDDARRPCYGTVRIPVTPARSLSRMLATETSTGCYIVTLRGARKLLAGTRNYMLPVDTMMFSIHSKIFWTLDVWKLRDAAAIQLTMFQRDGGLHDEFRDRIQGAARPEQARDLAGRLRRWRVRLRRLMDSDTGRQRGARARRETEKFAALGGIDRTNISFSGGDLSHYRAAQALLDDARV